MRVNGLKNKIKTSQLQSLNKEVRKTSKAKEKKNYRIVVRKTYKNGKV